ncbi:opacity protein-like surface antigen [Elusimicrobium posterum]|uniref:outer membrane beta-barrel protein n=1 Tax=Elusimicrobium posterum TaxID=3116653 RepID=UPI003C785343
MIKKILLSVFAVCTMAAFASAEIGVGARMGFSADKSNMKDYEQITPITSSDYNNLKGFIFGAEVLFEKEGLFNMAENHSFGLKAGIDANLKEDVELKSGVIANNIEISSQSIMVPVSVYYRYSPEPGQGMSYYVGGGAAWVMTSFKGEGPIYDIDETDSKVSPFINAGTEYRFNKLFALGLDLRYLFSAKMETEKITFNGEKLKRDMTGFSGAVTARFYF